MTSGCFLVDDGAEAFGDRLAPTDAVDDAETACGIVAAPADDAANAAEILAKCECSGAAGEISLCGEIPPTEFCAISCCQTNRQSLAQINPQKLHFTHRVNGDITRQQQ